MKLIEIKILNARHPSGEIANVPTGTRVWLNPLCVNMFIVVTSPTGTDSYSLQIDSGFEYQVDFGTYSRAKRMVEHYLRTQTQEVNVVNNSVEVDNIFGEQS